MEHDHLKNNRPAIHKPSKLKEYSPLVGVLLFVLALTALTFWLGRFKDAFEFIRLFMGFFFLVFGSFKLLDLPGFVMAYREYDIVAGHIRAYAWLYPFLELSLAILYFTNASPFHTNLTTAIVMFVSSIGVMKAVRGKKKVHCACLGVVIKLPMSTITIIEDIGMGIMALVMLSLFL